MTCQECEHAQGRGDVTYVRVDKANILVSGCREHLKMLMDQLTKNAR
jgi:hypothetical protein